MHTCMQADQLHKVERWLALPPEELQAVLRDYPPDAGEQCLCPPCASPRPAPAGRLLCCCCVVRVCVRVCLLVFLLDCHHQHPPPPPPPAEEVSARGGQARAARRLLNIQKALSAMHEDEEFQADAAQVCAAGPAPPHSTTHTPPTCPPLLRPPMQPHVRAAVDALRADPSKYEQYTSDPQASNRLHPACAPVVVVGVVEGGCGGCEGGGELRKPHAAPPHPSLRRPAISCTPPHQPTPNPHT